METSDYWTRTANSVIYEACNFPPFCQIRRLSFQTGIAIYHEIKGNNSVMVEIRLGVKAWLKTKTTAPVSKEIILDGM